MTDAYKFSQDKHLKYYDFFSNLQSKDKEYWGIGIENESYLMFDKLYEVDKNFLINNQKRERYSVDYWVNFKKDKLLEALNKLPEKIYLPTYLNSYLFQKNDIFGEPTKKYTKLGESNPNFSGETIDEYLKNNSTLFNKLFEKNIIYDGDTFEFTTFNFYKTNVKNVINELVSIKKIFLDEINEKLVNKNNNEKYIFKDKIIYPPFNYGFAKFQTNLKNVAICNNGTYHINITLPTDINKDGKIIFPVRFQQVHSNAIRAIQWIEPFLVALYGSPDILHMLNKDYSGGSLRLMLSRYIGLGTYDENKMEKGKMLNDFNYKNKNHYLEKLHENSPYILPETTGYDINYNKFLKHGIELRFFDYFPEEHLEDIINLIILVCAHSSFNKIPDPKENKLWQNFVIDVLKHGSNAMVSHELNDLVKTIFDTFTPNIFHFLQNKKPRTILHFVNKLSGKLYKMYHDFSICSKLSPNMKPMNFIDYNNKIKQEFKKSINII